MERHGQQGQTKCIELLGSKVACTLRFCSLYSKGSGKKNNIFPIKYYKNSRMFHDFQKPSLRLVPSLGGKNIMIWRLFRRRTCCCVESMATPTMSEPNVEVGTFHPPTQLLVGSRCLPRRSFLRRLERDHQLDLFMVFDYWHRHLKAPFCLKDMALETD